MARQFELRVRRADGVSRWFETRVDMVREDGSAPRLVGIVTDVTDRKDSEAHLLAADRLSSMGLLAAGIAHEIANPLTALFSLLDVAGEAVKHPPRLHEVTAALADAREAAAQMRAILADLRVFSRPDEDATAPVDLGEVVETACRMIGAELRTRARLVKQIEPAPRVHGRASHLGQVALNLLMNAMHAIPIGASAKHEVRVTVGADAKGALFRVSDTGVGMTEEVRARIFTPFFTTKPGGEGTGLGLAICHRIVTGLGGTLEVESEPGRGTTFTVRLTAAGT